MQDSGRIPAYPRLAGDTNRLVAELPFGLVADLVLLVVGTRMSRWKLGSMVSKWVIDPNIRIYEKVI